MLPIIIVLIIATAVVIGLYQLIIQKHYWGPKGPPQEDKRMAEAKRKRTGNTE
jgi:hypothetical protein